MNEDIRKLLGDAAASKESVEVVARCAERIAALARLGATGELIAGRLIEAFGHEEAQQYLRDMAELCAGILDRLDKQVQLDAMEAAQCALQAKLRSGAGSQEGV